MVSSGAGRLALAVLGAFVLSACEEGSDFNLFNRPDASVSDEALPAPADAETFIERDVEKPDVFGKTETGLWDGRPSLGGVWVAHPDVVDPERVIIRNRANGSFVIGALFRRERENPGPPFQVSSDAAAALKMLAGAPVELSVIALRLEKVLVIPEVVEPAAAEPDPVAEIKETSLTPVAEIAASAIEAATAKATAAPVSAKLSPLARPVRPTPVARPVQQTSLEKPFIQIGIFSIEANAINTSDLMRSAGIIPTVVQSESSGKTIWRVIVGPASDASERTALLETVKGLGFADAYAVTN